MIKKADKTVDKKVSGISLAVLANGKDTMITRVHLKPGDIIPEHSHGNEQCGYLVSGKMRLLFGDFDEVLTPGDSYCIPGGTLHSAEAMVDTLVLDFFAPPRKDYLALYEE